MSFRDAARQPVDGDRRSRRARADRAAGAALPGNVHVSGTLPGASDGADLHRGAVGRHPHQDREHEGSGADALVRAAAERHRAHRELEGPPRAVRIRRTWHFLAVASASSAWRCVPSPRVPPRPRLPPRRAPALPPVAQPMPLNAQAADQRRCRLRGRGLQDPHDGLPRTSSISQGSTRVRADHARGHAVSISRTAAGPSRATCRSMPPPRGSLRSDQATVEFRNNRIAGATITGNPARVRAAARRRSRHGEGPCGSDRLRRGPGHGAADQGRVDLGRAQRDERASIAYSIREQKVLATSAGRESGRTHHHHAAIDGRSRATPGSSGAAVHRRHERAATTAGSGATGATATPPPGSS